MIEVIYETRYPAEFLLEMSGHAGAGEPGKDLVCCAASMMGYALEAHMLHHKDAFRPVVQRDAEKGLYRLTAKPKALCCERCEEAFETVMDGLRLLRECNSDFISIEERTIDDGD